jgi:hypothetical protein
MKPVFQATALKAAREELSKAIAIIERTKWERTTYLTKNLAACPESSEAPESGQTTRSLVHINLSAGMKDAKTNLTLPSVGRQLRRQRKLLLSQSLSLVMLCAPTSCPGLRPRSRNPVGADAYNPIPIRLTRRM